MDRQHHHLSSHPRMIPSLNPPRQATTTARVFQLIAARLFCHQDSPPTTSCKVSGALKDLIARLNSERESRISSIHGALQLYPMHQPYRSISQIPPSARTLELTHLRIPTERRQCLFPLYLHSRMPHRSSVGLLNNASSARSSTTVQVDTKTHEDSSNTAPRKLLEAAEVRDLKRKSITVQDPLGSIELLKSHVAEQIVATRATHESVWLDSLNMPLANLRTFDQCVHLFSRNGLCPFELVVADIGEVPKPDEVPPDGFTRSDPLINGKSQWWNLETELKVFQGNCIVKTLTLPTPPTCLLSIRDGSSPAPQKPPPNASLSPPILALASGPHIYLYRDWEPLTKFTLPPVEPSSQEAEIWSQLLAPEAERAAQVAASEGPLEQGAGMNRELVAVALSELKALRETGNVELTIRSLRLMSLEGLRNNALFEGADFPTDAQVDFARAMAEKKLRIEPVITCGTTLDRVVGESKMDCLVFGSEEKRVYVISPPNYSIIEQSGRFCWCLRII
ncbi:hypothetical protein DFJ73DRAFT_64304 [Zopfochytrium polystomum]|nr:hypothetical protein DFJ73DRAFT_64304 [Zopfochytrium polystomum]